MTSCSSMFCAICDAQHITKNAEHWCPECEESFCLECLKHHNFSKYTRSHDVISIENYRKLPPSISRKVNHCAEHDLRYQNYCNQHQSPCCQLCISTNHRECVGLLTIEEFIKSSETSTMIDKMERSLKEIAVNLEKLVEDLENNLKNVAQQRQQYQDEIKMIREKINDHLDKLETKIIEDLNTTGETIKLETEHVINQMQQKSKKVEELQNTLDAVKRYASGLQIFLGSKTLEAQVDKEEQCIQSLSEDARLKQISLEFRIDENISYILSTITTFGSVCKEKCPPIKVKSEKDEQARIVAIVPPVVPTSVHVMNFVLKHKFQIPKDKYTTDIRGCVITLNGKFIVVDNSIVGNSNHRLVFLNSDRTLQDQMALSLYPVDVTIIKDKHVAVSTGFNRQIFIINTEFKKINRTIATSDSCYGITCSDGKLVYLQYGTGIQVLDLNSDVPITLVRDKTILGWGHITIFKDQIYYTNCDTNTVTCCTVTGEMVWTFKEESILVGLRGIAVDTKSNVFVASCRNGTVVAISPDRKHARQVLGKKTGIDTPESLYFDRGRNILAVGSKNGTIFVYSVS